jgi:hypothetical protein
MAKNRVGITGVQGTAWGIPEAVGTELGVLAGAADSVLAAAKNESTRTPVVTAHCREAFKRLEDKMRDIKRRYFLSPPLTEADFIASGLRPADHTPSPTGRPEAQIQVEPFLYLVYQ